MQKLPNSQQAFIDTTKLTSYCLNPEHSEGQHKAAVFKAALNIGLAETEILKNALLQAVQNYSVTAIESNLYGQKYLLEFEMQYQNKVAIIRSVWLMRHNENFARLVTCYVLKEKK
jgi:hypothetical protein